MKKSYLSEKWQHLIIKGSCTIKKQILTGVPQVQKYGPFFFWLSMNDLDASKSDSKMTIFADDATLINAETNKKNFNTKGYRSGFDSNKLTLNRDSFELTFSGSRNPQVSRKDNIPRKCKNSCMYLGVYLDKRPRFNQHIDMSFKN